jgi:D-aspartate ligase
LIEVSNTLVPIVILQSAPSLQHGGLSVARTAGRLGIRVYWVHGQSRPPAATSRYVYRTFRWNESAPAETSVEYLLDYSRQIGREPILIPVDDTAAIFIADQAEALRERFLFPDQPAGLARSLSSKKEMYLLCRKMGIPTPEVAFPDSGDDVAAFVESAVFPVVLKRIAGWLPEHRTQDSVTIINNPEELLEEYKKIENPGEPNVMLQEYIPGSPDSFWAFAGFFTNESEGLVGFTGKKIRQSPPFRGVTTLGICLKNETLEKTAVDFMRKVSYSGIVDMEYRYDRRDDQYKLLDVNPRIGAQFRVFVDSNGMDVVRALYLHLTGQPVQPGTVCEGRKWIVEQSDLMTSLRYAQLGKLTLMEWVRSLRGVQETAWFARDDLVPFVIMCLTSLATLGRRLWRKRRLNDA